MYMVNETIVVDADKFVVRDDHILELYKAGELVFIAAPLSWKSVRKIDPDTPNRLRGPSGRTNFYPSREEIMRNNPAV